MEITELYYPQIAAYAGPYTFDRGIRVEIHSSKNSYFDWAKIRFTEEYQPEISLARKEPASIELGYDNVYDSTFTGYVAKPYSTGTNADEIVLKDDMYSLLFAPLRMVQQSANQWAIFFSVIGKLFDDTKQDIFRVRAESMGKAAVSHILYHTTLCNHLLTWARQASTADELATITYGATLPDDLKANMEAIINAASA